MAAKHSRHIAPTEPLIAHVEDQLARGGYTSIREVVRTAFRHMIEREHATAARSAVAPASSVAVNDRA
jgi:antitoxin ParD1/3/4